MSRNPRRRRRYTVDEVVDAALAVIGDRGLDALTMRTVAERLGASPMALYRYVVDRDDLVARAADRSMADLDVPPEPADDGIRAWLVAVTLIARQRLLRYPGVADHLLLHGPTGPWTLRFMSDVCRVLRRTGRTAEEAAWAYDWLMTTAAAYVSKETRLVAGARSGDGPAALLERAERYMSTDHDLLEVVRSFHGDMEAAFRRATGAVIDSLVAGPSTGS